MIKVDLVDEEGSGLLVLHDGSKSWQRTDDGVRAVLNLYDPWDEDHWRGTVRACLHLGVHGPMAGGERMRRGQEYYRPIRLHSVDRAEQSAPAEFTPVTVEGSGVLATALYREHQKAGEGLTDWFGEGIRNPFVLRLVEGDGRANKARLRLPGPIECIAKTNLLGVVEQELQVEPHREFGSGGPWVTVTVELRAHEIATVMFDSVPGRHVPRNLDDHRQIWATVHRTDDD